MIVGVGLDDRHPGNHRVEGVGPLADHLHGDLGRPLIAAGDDHGLPRTQCPGRRGADGKRGEAGGAKGRELATIQVRTHREQLLRGKSPTSARGLKKGIRGPERRSNPSTRAGTSALLPRSATSFLLFEQAILIGGSRRDRRAWTRAEDARGNVTEPARTYPVDDPGHREAPGLLRPEPWTEPRVPGRVEEDPRAKARAANPEPRTAAERHRALVDAPGPD